MTTHHAGSGDFDFLVGRWHVHHRRLKERLRGCDEWETFGGTCEVTKMLAGHANVDDNVIDLPGGAYRAMTIRSFDAATGDWMIWWLDGRTPHTLDAPLRGRFIDGIGTFRCADSLAGKPILIRFLWTLADDTGAPQWEQAFSADDGGSWEVNWRMTFIRQGAA